VSEAQGRHRGVGLKETWSKNASRRTRTEYDAYGRRTSWPVAAKSASFKSTGRKFGGCALKAVELTSGGQPHVSESELRVERSSLTV
jgi:YD repeat-containing protein